MQDLRLLLVTEAPVMTPNGIDFSFLSFFFTRVRYSLTLQVLDIVYLGNYTTPGGFFPSGVTGKRGDPPG